MSREQIKEEFLKSYNCSSMKEFKHKLTSEKFYEIMEDYFTKCSYNKKYKDEIENLSKRVDYLRSGEYLNQLRFERDVLQHVVDNGKVSKEDKNFIDMAHRNTELLEENHKLKKQLETVGKKYEFEAKNRDKVYKMLRKKDSQQKEFIAHLEDMLVSELDIFTVVRVCDVLSKYKEIIGVKDE